MYENDGGMEQKQQAQQAQRQLRLKPRCLWISNTHINSSNLKYESNGCKESGSTRKEFDHDPTNNQQQHQLPQNNGHDNGNDDCDDDNVTTMPVGTITLDTYESIWNHYSYRPHYQTYLRLCSNSLVVIQEIALSCYFLARHHIMILTTSTNTTINTQQQQQPKFIYDHETTILFVEYSTYLILIALFIIMYYSTRSDQTNQIQRSIKMQHRFKDSLLLIVLLRYISGTLQSLTASYSTDTVQLLAYMSMLVHVLFCDYTYSNGIITTGTTSTNDSLPTGTITSTKRTKKGTDVTKDTVTSPNVPDDTYTNSRTTFPSSTPSNTIHNTKIRRPPFLGGTVSLNASLFSATLLVSRFHNNNNNNDKNTSITTSYMIMTLAIILFAFYPITRHSITVSFPSHSSRAMWMITFFICWSTILLLFIIDNSNHDNTNEHNKFSECTTQQQSTLQYTSFLMTAGNNIQLIYVLLGCWYQSYPLVTGFIMTLISVGFIVPMWKYYIQHYKIVLRGPWDIPSTSSMQLDYNIQSKNNEKKEKYINPTDEYCTMHHESQTETRDTPPVSFDHNNQAKRQVKVKLK